MAVVGTFRGAQVTAPGPARLVRRTPAHRRVGPSWVRPFSH